MEQPTDGTLIDQFVFDEDTFSVLVKHTAQTIDSAGIAFSFYIYAPYGFNPSDSGLYINGEDGVNITHKLYTLKVDSEATSNPWATDYISRDRYEFTRFYDLAPGYVRSGYFTLIGAGTKGQKIGSLRNKGGSVKVDRQEYSGSPYTGSFQSIFRMKFHLPENESDPANSNLTENEITSVPMYIECLSKSNPNESGQYPDDALELPPNTPPITLVSTIMNSSTSNLAQARSGARKVGNDDLTGPAPVAALGPWCAYFQNNLYDYWADYLSVSKGEPTFTSPLRSTGNFASCIGVYTGSFKDRRWKQFTTQDVLDGREHLQKGDLYFFMDGKPKPDASDYNECFRVMNRQITDPSQIVSKRALSWYNALHGKESFNLSHIVMVRNLVSTQNGGDLGFQASGRNFHFLSIEGNGGTTIPGWYNVGSLGGKTTDSNGRSIYGWQSYYQEDGPWYYHNIPEWTEPGPNGSWASQYFNMRNNKLKDVGATDGRGVTSIVHKINDAKHRFNVILRFMGTEQPCAVPTPPAGQPT